MCGQVCGCCYAPRAQAPMSSRLVEQTPAFPHPLSLFCRQLILQLLSQGVACSSSDCVLGVKLPGLEP